MLPDFRRLSRLLVAVGFFAIGALAAHPAQAQIRTAFGLTGFGDRSPVEVTIQIISWILGVLAIIAVCFVVYGGFLWMFSGGNEDKLAKAKLVLRNAFIGTFIILAAWGITLYVLGVLAGITGTAITGDGSTSDNCIGCTVPTASSDFYVQSTTPEADESNVPLCQAVAVYMSQGIDTSTVTGDTFSVAVSGGRAAGSSCTTNTDCASSACSDAGVCEGDSVGGQIGFGPGAEPTAFDFVLSSDLESNTTYVATLQAGQTGILSSAGLSMTLPYQWQFTTGTDTDNVLPYVLESSNSPYPADGTTAVCRNTVINFDFSENMLPSSFNDDTSMVLDYAGTSDAPVTPAWDSPIALDDWDLGSGTYAMARPDELLAAYSLYSARLYGGDPANDYTGGPLDMCGNPLDGNFNTLQEGDPSDNYFGHEASEPEVAITWETDDQTECIPEIESVSQVNGYYGEYAAAGNGEACTARSDCGSGLCSAGVCVGSAATTIDIVGKNLGPHPQVLLEGSDVWAAADLNTCFDPDHFGNIASNASRGDECVDAADQTLTAVTLRRPVGSADTPVIVEVAGEQSQPSSTEISVSSPHITGISPENGGAGQYITISGENFGAIQGSGGSVILRSIQLDGTVRESLLALPEACGNTWSDTQIVAVAPETYDNPVLGTTGAWADGDIGLIQVVTNDGRYSDSENFTFSSVERPNLCPIEPPACGNTGGESINLTGERFGAAQGDSQVALAGDDSGGYNALINGWSDTAISGTTDSAMEEDHYYVSVYDTANDLSSNVVDYNIPCAQGPQVVTISSCDPSNGVYSVPTPKPDSASACINATVGVLFDQPMDANSFNSGTVYIEQYNTGSTFDSSATTSSVAGNFNQWEVVTGDSDQYSGFQFDVTNTADDSGVASSYFQSDRWYQLTVTDNVTNTDGVPMADDYVMRFHTDDSGDLCVVDSVDVQPSETTKNAYKDDAGAIIKQPYVASPYTNDCQLLDSSSYSWDWAISDTAIGNFGTGPGHTNTQNVYVAGKASDNEGTATVTAAVDAVDDDASFTVALGYCETDSDCSASCGGSSCNADTNTCTPVIKNFSPSSGAQGTWVTINGCMFGSATGSVDWQSGVINAATEWPDVAECSSTLWTNDTIIAEVPADYDTNGDDTRDALVPDGLYTIDVGTAAGDHNTSTNPFTVNDTTHPGLCALDPDRQASGGGIIGYGQNLGTATGTASYAASGQRVAGAIDSWTDALFQSTVPTTAVSSDDGVIAVVAGSSYSADCQETGSCSNSLPFEVSCGSDSDCESGVCSEAGVCVPSDTNCLSDSDCTANGACSGSSCTDGVCTPVITQMDPTSGPLGSPTTIQGCYFGDGSGDSSLTFATASASVIAPLLCDGRWEDDQIIAQVPEDGAFVVGDSASVSVTRSDGVVSNGSSYRFSAQCGSGGIVPETGHPVLCDFDPASGSLPGLDGVVAGSTIAFSGQNFVETAQRNLFAGLTALLAGTDFRFIDTIDTRANVPNDAISGNAYAEVTATDAVASCQSNGLEFSVSCETAADCGADAACIDGQCVANSSCGCSLGDGEAVCGYGGACYSSNGIGCCALRPTLVATNPQNDETNVCPNRALTVQFSIQVADDLGGGQIYFEQLSSSGEVLRTIRPTSVTQDPSSLIATISFTTDGSRTSTALEPNATYRMVIQSSIDGHPKHVRASDTGLTLDGGTKTISFTTALDTCVPEQLLLLNDNNQTSSYTFTAEAESTDFTAHVYADDGTSTLGQEITPTSDVDWAYSWLPYYDENSCQNVAYIDAAASTAADSPAQPVMSGSENDGVETLTTTITSTTTDTWTGSLDDSASLRTFFCAEDALWQYDDSFAGDGYVEHRYPQNFNLVYCADNVPKLTGPLIIDAEAEGIDDGWFLQYLFLNQDEEEAFAIRVYQNTERLTPDAWYQKNVPNPGNPTVVEADGYAGVRDGTSYYIAATNISPDNSGDGATDTSPSALYSNIFLFTFTDDNVADSIQKQIMDYVRFNYNVSYAACEGSDKAKLVRDTKRVSNLGTIASLATDYYAANNTYPEPQSDTFGSFIQNITTSVWGSWQGALGNLFGQSLPTDPYNFFSVQDNPWEAGSQPWIDPDTTNDCEYDPDRSVYYDESGTCWDPVNHHFYCPADSYTYMWKVQSDDATNAELYAHLEYDGGSDTQDYITSPDSNYNPCSDAAGDVTAECECFNYGIHSDAGSAWDQLPEL